MQASSGFAGIPDLCEQITGALKGTNIHLHGQTLSSATSVSTATSASDWMSAEMWLRRHQGPWEAPGAAPFTLGRWPVPPQVFVVSGGGTTLSSGALNLQNGACVVLDSTCMGVKWRDVAMTGAAPPLPTEAPTTRCLIEFIGEQVIDECSALVELMQAQWRVVRISAQ